MGYLNIKDIYSEPPIYDNIDINVCGWIRTMRVSKTFGFIEINDGTFFKNMQIVFDDGLENFKEISKLGIGSAIVVYGKFILTPESKQSFEIRANDIKIEGLSDKDYPLQKKRHTMEYLRTIAYLRPRTNTFSAVFRVRSILAQAVHRFFFERGFVYVHTPIITGSDCEGAGEMFRVTSLDSPGVTKNKEEYVDYSKDFFGKETSLTVSGQLSAETFALAFKNVYTFGPTFRAENSNTARHAAEFWMIEPEIAFANLCDNMELAEDMFKYMIKFVMDNAVEELEFFNSFIDKGIIERLENVLNSKFGQVTYTEAIDILKNSNKKFEYEVTWGKDLQTEHERFLAEEIFKKPVFVIDYPKEIKAFYMRLNDDNKTVAAMDLLVPGVGEIIGGSQREERLDILEKQIKDFGLNKDDYWWYINLRRYGGTKHAGFGMGFERAVMYITGMQNIRDVIPYPRTVKNAEF